MFKKKSGIIVLLLCTVLAVGYFAVNTGAVSTVLLAIQGAITDGNLVKFSGTNGIGVDTGLSATNVVKCKFDATIAPTVNNDTDEGYTVGSRWLDITNDKSYICLDNTDGAAVWHLDVVGPGASTDHAIVRWDSTTGRTTLNSVVTVSDAGVIAGGEWQGTVVSPVYGGTGIANNVASTITISGSYAMTLTITGVTGVTLPTSGTLCVTTGTPETTFQIDDDNSGPKLKNSAGEMQIRNAADDAYADLRALSFYGDGSNLTGVGAAAASALTISAKAAENISKGQVVYISGATGQTPEVRLADNTDSAKHLFLGVAAETKTTGQTILIRVRGELINIDTSTFSDGNLLYLTTGGGLTATAPTSGAVETIGYCSYSHVSAGKLIVMHHSPHSIYVASGSDIVIRMGDSVGSNTVKFKNYADAQLISIDSYGRIWHTVGSTAVTGDITGLRTIVTSSAASGGDAPTGQATRAIYAQVVVAASKHVGLLQAGLFTASGAAGSVTAYDIHVLCAHYSSGASTIIGGDFYVGYLRAQTRSTNARAVTGHDVLLALENEAIEGAGATMDSAIRIFDTNVAGSGFTYGIDMSDAVIATADMLLSQGETIKNTTDGRIDFGGADVNIDTGKKFMVNGVQITSAVLSDVGSIGMLDEAETIAGNWVNTDNPWADNEVANDITVDSATSYVASEIRLKSSDADPDTTGEIKHDSTATGFSGGVLRWYDDDSSRMIVDLETDASADDYVVAYDSTADGFYMKEDDAGVSAFIDLTDTPANYTDDGGKYVRVNVGEDALEFAAVTGEANTASNIGAEIEIFKQKAGVDLEFRTLKAMSSKITISNTTAAVLKISNEVNTSEDYVITGQYAGAYWLAGSGYILGIISVYMARYNAGGLMTMQVYEADVNGHPTGGELGSVQVDCTGISTSNTWIDFDLTSEAISIVNATKYCWYISGGGADDGVKVRYTTSDEVANTWRIYYGGETWGNNTGHDNTFKLYTSAGALDYIKFDVAETEMNVVNLLSVTTVAFDADADTTLYTVPTGKRCVLSHAIVVAAGDAGATTTVSIGQNTAETDFIPANTLSNLDAEYDAVILQPIPNTTPLKTKSYAAATVIEAQVASQSGVAGNTIYLFGILY